MIKYFPLYILALLVFLSCKKTTDDQMMVSGQLLNPFSNSAVEGANVDLYAKKIEPGVWNATYTLIKSTTTDNSGSFSMAFDVIRASNYKIIFKKAKYMMSDVELNPDKIQKGQDYKQNYSIFSEAFLKIHIAGSLPIQSFDDQITYKITKGFLKAESCCWDSTITYSGPEIDHYRKCKVYGSQWISFEWNTKKNNAIRFYKDSVFCQPFDTTNFNIIF